MPALRVLLFVGLALFLSSIVHGQDVRLGDRVVLVAREQGVPVHDLPQGTDDHRKVAGSLMAEVLEITGLDGRWLRLEIPEDPGDARPDWVHRKYVARVLDRDEPGGPGPVVPPTDDRDDERRVFSSPEGCRQVVVEEGRRMAGSVADALRVGSWNVRWFPVGCPPGEDCVPTDVAWLACTIAWMDLDVLALQEILATSSAAESMRELLDQLDELTGGAWHSDLQTCGSPEQQRVGFLWNRDRIVLGDHADLWQINGAAIDANDPCAGNLRPGRYARAAVEGGADFQLVTVHLDAGQLRKDFENRRRSTGRLATLTVGEELLFVLDRDVLVLGDFNSMGSSELGRSAEEERTELALEVAPLYRHLPSAPACTQYFRGTGDALDHVLVTEGTQEVETSVRVSGYCAVEGCGPLGDRSPAAYVALSDHCPLVLEVRNADLDSLPPTGDGDDDPPPDDVPDTDLETYYRDVDASTAESLRRTLHARIRDHQVFPYSHSSKTDTWDVLEQADADPRNPSRVLDVYLNASYLRVGGGNNDYNREHSWPKSYGFPSSNDPPYTDCHHLFLSNIEYNRDRDRALFDDCDADCFRFATRRTNELGGNDGPFPDDDNWLRRSGGQSAVWQVWGPRRGDVARAMFYMDVRYEGGVHATLNRREPDLVLLDNLTSGGVTSRADGVVEARMGDLCTLLAWHLADPPDERDRWRNDVVDSFQKNRNPFVDHPEWAEVLFASQCGGE